MKITEVTHTHTNWITLDNGEEFLRFTPEVWHKSYGSSLEEVYFNEELEEIYGEYVKTSGTGMANTFFIADTHFSHGNILTFTNHDGTLLRPFSSVEEMDETMISNWNNVVRPNDKVYHLGDVAMSHRHLPKLSRLNGEKVLIKGNHDTGKLSQYVPYFKDIRGSHQFDGKLLTHIPTHPDSLYRWGVNIHGHLHSYKVHKEVHHICKDDPPGYTERVLDTRYFCVSVEQINYTPISYEDLKKALTK